MSDQQGEHNRIHRILAASEHIQDKRQEVIRDQRILVALRILQRERSGLQHWREANYQKNLLFKGRTVC